MITSKKVFTIICIIGITTNLVSQENLTDKRTGIPISFNREENMFPSSWYTGGINAIVTPLDTSEFIRSERIITKTLLKYPKSFLIDNLSKIYILNEVKFYGLQFGGTYYSDKVYMTNKGEAAGYTDKFIEQVFHEEFSSILLVKYNDSFNEDEWKNLNTEDFKYGQGGTEALRNNTFSQAIDTSLCCIGLLSQYSFASIEEDFNTLTKNIFLASDDFWKVVDAYPLINKKVDMIINFYNKIDSTFTYQYFQRISKE